MSSSNNGKQASSKPKSGASAAPSRSGFQNGFRVVAQCTAAAVGSSWTFVLAVLLIVAWALSYKLWDSFDTWQLVINTLTTIVTFLMVFLIQNTQNRDARAVHLKLDELIRGVQGARNHLVDLENLSDEELDALHDEFQRLRTKTREVAGEEHPAVRAIEELNESVKDEKEDRSNAAE